MTSAPWGTPNSSTVHSEPRIAHPGPRIDLERRRTIEPLATTFESPASCGGCCVGRRTEGRLRLRREESSRPRQVIRVCVIEHSQGLRGHYAAAVAQCRRAGGRLLVEWSEGAVVEAFEALAKLRRSATAPERFVQECRTIVEG